jgi:F0F1-type ATP synthase membrane subunit b/b'
MRFWTAYAFIALGIATKAWSSSEGGHHASLSDLIAPAFNVAVLFGVLIYATKDKLKSYFVSFSETVSNTLERANTKSKEAEQMLGTQKSKMANLDSEIKNLNLETEAEVISYEKKLAKETEEKIAKLKVDANSKVVADKKQMTDALNSELLEQVIKKTKSTIKGNESYQNKVSSKMLEGLK